MIDIKEILERTKGLHKFGGVAPEGFVLIHEKTLDDLRNFDTWMLWTEGKVKLSELDTKNFDKYK